MSLRGCAFVLNYSRLVALRPAFFLVAFIQWDANSFALTYPSPFIFHWMICHIKSTSQASRYKTRWKSPLVHYAKQMRKTANWICCLACSLLMAYSR